MTEPNQWLGLGIIIVGAAVLIGSFILEVRKQHANIQRNPGAHDDAASAILKAIAEVLKQLPEWSRAGIVVMLLGAAVFFGPQLIALAGQGSPAPSGSASPKPSQ